MDSHTASAVSRLLSGSAVSPTDASSQLVHLGPVQSGAADAAPDTQLTDAACWDSSTFGSLSGVLGQPDDGGEQRLLRADGGTAATSTESSSCLSAGSQATVGDQLLRDRILGKARLRRWRQQLSSSNAGQWQATGASRQRNFSDVDDDAAQPPPSEPSAGPASTGGSPDKWPPIPLVNLARRDRYGVGGGIGGGGVGGGPSSAGLHELSHRPTDTSSNATSKRAVVGSAASADVSHLVLDVRDLAGFKEMRHFELSGALCRWILRRIFRADWSRDCFLCDLPLTHSCLMCFHVLHAAPDQEATRSYNAVICGGVHATCGHVYHRHCWSRWESQLSPCCPKCGASGIGSVKDTFIIEKRCG